MVYFSVSSPGRENNNFPSGHDCGWKPRWGSSSRQKYNSACRFPLEGIVWGAMVRFWTCVPSYLSPSYTDTDEYSASSTYPFLGFEITQGLFLGKKFVHRDLISGLSWSDPLATLLLGLPGNTCAVGTVSQTNGGRGWKGVGGNAKLRQA